MNTTMRNVIQIVHVNNYTDAAELAIRGYEPIECSFGTEGSVLGPLAMDHHGAESHREGVAVRSYRDHFGARRDDPRFVVTGDADQDATFAIAALAGLLPHPSRAAEFEQAPPHVRSVWTQDLSELAELTNAYDVAPIGLRLETQRWGPTLILWDQTASTTRDVIAFFAGVDRWRALLSRPPRALLEAVQREEALRVEVAMTAAVTGVSEAVALVESSLWGFDVWYAEHAPIVVAWSPDDGNVTVGAKDAPTAERLLGPGGLKNAFSKLQPAGWGGRESIGGSPRGMPMTRKQALEAAITIAGLVVG